MYDLSDNAFDRNPDIKLKLHLFPDTYFIAICYWIYTAMIALEPLKCIGYSKFQYYCLDYPCRTTTASV